MLRSTPTPSPEAKPSSTPQRQASSYQQYREQTRISGRITDRGISSVNAVGTPLGRYQKALFDAIGSRWYAYVEGSRDLINIGTTHVMFNVDPSGHVTNFKIIEKTGNEASANMAIRSVQDARLPVMSEDLAATVPPEGLTIDIPFTIFGN
jgi:outer membrane biosynthesis protein TonB